MTLPRNSLLVLLSSAAVLHAGAYYPAKPGETVVPNQYLVRLPAGVAASQVVQSLRPGGSLEPLRALNIQRLTLPPGFGIADAARLAANPLVTYVEPNRVRAGTLAGPNDSLLGQQ